MGRSEHAPRVVGLHGGGLDSALAFAAARRSGVEVEGLHFDTGFVRRGHRDAARAAESRGELRVVDVRQRYLERVVLAPRHGYGSGMNPCHDCRAFFLREAARHAAGRSIEWLLTGDVVGQRAHDQSHEAFSVAERDAGVEGRVWRPLSARHRPAPPALPATPEGCGALQGRSRRGQLALAARWGVDRFPTPSGRCCRLADPAFARRLRDYLEHLDGEAPRARDLPLLDVGRHFRLAWNLKVVLARTFEEWSAMEALAGRRGRCEPLDARGPSGLVEGTVDERRARAVAALVASHCRLGNAADCRVRIGHPGGEIELASGPATAAEVEVWRI